MARQPRADIDNRGFSQADLGRELGVTQQAIQKMIAVGAERPGK
jgi:biotin operon repressor